MGRLRFGVRNAASYFASYSGDIRYDEVVGCYQRIRMAACDEVVAFCSLDFVFDSLDSERFRRRYLTDTRGECGGRSLTADLYGDERFTCCDS